MDLYINGKKFCQVLSASLSDEKEAVLQFGAIKPLDVKPVVNLIVSKLPVIGMGAKLELVEDGKSIGVDYKNGFEHDGKGLLQVVVIKKTN